MKKIVLYFLLLSSMAGYAQTSVVSLYGHKKTTDGIYYKDLDNDLDYYVGTWEYVSGTTTLTIILEKRIMKHFQDNYNDYYEDILVGEYRYVENGVEKVNTLANISTIYDNAYEHYICGNALVGQFSPRTVLTSFGDPNIDIIGLECHMAFKRADENGVEKLHSNFIKTHEGVGPLDGPTPTVSQYTVPFGKYLLTKVN
ncbi:DUF6705 family protein [Flavobacterium rhizosphaerae]|uniref:DUF6705 family protein n=1 Tax=Flavobacterium rhizosphaerae TaxID=3163298 RepID=A0ABW8YUB6_9FLAO